MSGSLLTTPLRQISTVKDLIVNQHAHAQLATVVANRLRPDRMMKVLANSIRTTPKLAKCDPMSLLGALMQCASLGLEPNTVLGHAYLIPFDNKRKGVTEVQLVVGYKGLIDLARRSGHITSISANIHYSDDEMWLYEEGTSAQLRHIPGPRDGQKLHAYAIAAFKDGGHAYVVLPWKHVMKIRDGSQGWKSAVKFNTTKDNLWFVHEDAMAMKTAIRALSKYLPLSIEYADAITLDEEKADYRAFAMDPTAGLSLTDDGDTIDGETVDPESGEVKVIDRAEKAKAVASDTEKKPAAKTQAKTVVDDAPAKQTDPDPETDRAQDQAQASLLTDEPAERDFSTSAKLRQFVADVREVGMEAAMDLWEQDLDAIKGKDPELHAAMMMAGTEAHSKQE